MVPGLFAVTRYDDKLRAMTTNFVLSLVVMHVTPRVSCHAQASLRTENSLRVYATSSNPSAI